MMIDPDKIFVVVHQEAQGFLSCETKLEDVVLSFYVATVFYFIVYDAATCNLRFEHRVCVFARTK